MHADQILGMTILVLRISGAAGLIGAVVALAIDYLGANRADIQPKSMQVASPSASTTQREPLGRSENYSKGPLLFDIVPAIER